METSMPSDSLLMSDSDKEFVTFSISEDPWFLFLIGIARDGFGD